MVVPGGGSGELAVLAEWTMLLEANDLAASTIADYSYAMFLLIGKHLRWKVHPLDVREAHAASLLASLSDRNSAKSQYAKGLRSFYTWAVRRGYLLSSPVGEIKPKKPRRQPQERFEAEELARLLMAAAFREPRRGWAMLACLALGTRRTEFVNITRNDIRWERGVVHLRVTKGRKPRDVGISAWAAEAMRELLAVSKSERLVEIEPNTFTRWVHEAAEDCGFPPGRMRRAHTLRATCLSMILENGAPLHVAQVIAGHASATTTSDYLAMVRGADRDAMKVFGGIGK
jgi:integrase/recombinase XerD